MPHCTARARVLRPLLYRASAALAALALIVMRGVEATAQSPQPPAADRKFEVASVKPALSPYELGAQAGRIVAGGGQAPAFRFGVQTFPGGRFTAIATLQQLIARAYDVKEYQIDGGPKWLTADYFEIAATAGRDATPDEFNSMLKALLVERFGLRARMDTRQAAVHVLTVARGDGRLGSGLKRTTPECQQQIEQRKNGAAAGAPRPPQSPRELPTTPTCGVVMSVSQATGARRMLYGGYEVSTLASAISSELTAPVVDRTNLAGLFDITLEFTSERQTTGRPPGLDPNSNDTPPPPLAIALQQQLGLKLERQMGPMPVVVIEAADHPSPD